MADESSEPTAELRADLTDALCRGRVTLAETAGIAPEELDAWYELACLRLDTQRDADAITLFAGLVTMFPYAAKYWRGYGIALHCNMQLRRALAAYDVALLLEPDSLIGICYRAEILLYVGRLDEALADLERVAQSADLMLRKRARDLLQFMAVQSNQDAIAAVLNAEPPIAALPAGAFALADGRTLPLDDSVFTAADAEPEPEEKAPRQETTARFFMALEDLPAPDERTDTAIIPGRRQLLRSARPARREGTQTAQIQRPDLAPPRPAPAEAIRPGIAPLRPAGPPMFRSATQLRRDGLPLTDEITLTNAQRDAFRDP